MLYNSNKNVHRFAIRGKLLEKERERKRERVRVKEREREKERD